jgi:hypothetical protein
MQREVVPCRQAGFVHDWPVGNEELQPCRQVLHVLLANAKELVKGVTLAAAANVATGFAAPPGAHHQARHRIHRVTMAS